MMVDFSHRPICNNIQNYTYEVEWFSGEISKMSFSLHDLH